MISWQGRYYNLYQTRQTQAECTAFVEGLLNNQHELITREMVIVKVSLNHKTNDIVVETKGICDDEHLYFTERYQGEWPSDVQVENFVQACFARWKIVFQRLNLCYVEKLYNRQQIGYRHAH